MQLTIECDVSPLLDKWDPNKVKEGISKGVEYGAQELVRTLMIYSPVDHGLLKSWFIESIDDTEAHIKTPAEYARYVNDGTSPHWIEPVNAKALHWEGYFSKGHVVSGIEGQHFVEDSIDDVEGRIDEYFLRALSEVLG